MLSHPPGCRASQAPAGQGKPAQPSPRLRAEEVPGRVPAPASSRPWPARIPSQFSCFSRVRLCDPMDSSTPGLPVHHQLPELAQSRVHRVGDAIQPSHPCCPLLFLPSIFPSIRIFSNESVLHVRWPKYWSFGFNISLSSEYSGFPGGTQLHRDYGARLCSLSVAT